VNFPARRLRYRRVDTFSKEKAMLSTLAIAPLAYTFVFPGGLISLAVIFFIIAILAYALGAKGMAGFTAGIGQTLLFVFLVLAVLSIIVSLIH